MPGNYNNSASFYDSLSRLVYGDTLVKAQIHFLTHIPAYAKVLIIGGGTGRILEEITKLYPSGLSITYVEIAEKMVALSRKRNTGDNKVAFINQAVENVSLPQHDVVITPFLFDNYKDKNLPATFKHIDSMLKRGGLWLNTDFQQTGKWWQYVLLKSMLLFFKVLCGVESWCLPDAAKQFSHSGYQLKQKKTFFKEFVVSTVYLK
jgi:ubiquinone/menaquinone biosynthesis C-methylase UbiE